MYSRLKFSQKGFSPFLLIAGVTLLLFLLITSMAPFRNKVFSLLFQKQASFAASPGFVDNFDGSPSTPQPFLQDPDSANWDIAVQSRDSSTWQTLETFEAMHGPDCAPPLDANNNLVTHHFDGSYANAVFKCKDHVMTSIQAGGYGVIYLTPNQILDFTNGEVVIKVDNTTLRTSGRDWWDIWITPYDENLQLPFDQGEVDLEGEPKDAVHISNDGNANGGGTGFHPTIFSNFAPTNDFQAFSNDYNWFTGYEQFMNVSPKQRTTFELHLSKNHIKFGIPAGQVDEKGVPINHGNAFWWFDKDITPLTWSTGIIQFGHHSYNPRKDCTPDPSMKSCYPNTWHWDAVSISNSTPFTIIKANKRMIDGGANNDTVVFNSPAPANSNLRFSGIGTIQVSFDGKRTWQTAPKQPTSRTALGGYHFEHLTSYWLPIPQGTTQVSLKFAPDNWYDGPYQAKDFAIWSTTILPAVSPSASAPSSKTGDISGNMGLPDGIIDIFDYNQLLTDFGSKDPNAKGNVDHIVNSQGESVDIQDYGLLLTNFGR